ncbi:MAG: Re/Si-specific NAD(P)(+) transhydrogenase subunit alpha [Gammaproteobacteria bacterium]|nr:MAG: Re/Si-specific NAD(P)(+) transhydrogenase subunit alpha [Gammaproteobacteria bacterium]
MIIGVPKEVCPGETRVALVPANVAALVKKGQQVLVEQGAGETAGYPDAQYTEAGASLVSREDVFAKADIIAQVQTAGQNRVNGEQDVARLKKGQLLIGSMDPLGNPAFAQQLAQTGASGMAMELIPRISRAQSMDVLSSMAMIAGYKAVLIAASTSPRTFPMNMTAAGTLSPARVFIMGAGVAGLQACATARRLGAVVEAYDVRAAAREQILSVGAKPIELKIDTAGAEGKGGYAAEQSEEFIRKQREAMGDVLAQQDVVITTAAIPGAKSPVLVTAEMVKRMKPGSVIVDLAAERGGNCELTKLGETVIAHGVTILGPENVPATVPFHASQMYGKNVENTLMHLIDKDGNLQYDLEDEIVVGTLVAHNGDVPHARMRELLKLAPKA